MGVNCLLMQLGVSNGWLLGVRCLLMQLGVSNGSVDAVGCVKWMVDRTEVSVESSVDAVERLR